MTEAATDPVREAPDDAGGGPHCWCCGQHHPDEHLVHLGTHPEVAVCLACAHYLHQRAAEREDTLHPSLAGRLRDTARSARRLVISRGWHHHPVLGRPLRWLGRRLP